MTNTYIINQNLLLESSSDDNYEENDTLATAYDLTTSPGVLLSSIDGAGISYADDEDWYKVTVDASAQYFSAFVTFPTNSRYIDLEVYNSDGTFISSAAYRFGTIDNYRREIKTILAPGDYYLKINSPFSDPNTNQISNTYDLSWDTQAISSVIDEYEDNDTQATATDISSQAGNYFTDLLLTDEDWYQIAVNPGEERLRLTYEIGNSENPVTLNIYDAAGNLINSLESLQSSPYVQEFNTSLPSDGTYYLQWVPSGTGNTYAFIWETLGLANLTISNAFVSNSNPELGDTISVSWTVENNGNYDTLEGWYDAVYLSEDTTLDESDIFLTNNYYFDNLITGSNYTQTIDLTIPNYLGLGSRYLLFVTDNYNYESEDDETDNVYSVPIEIGGDAPNLVITNATPISTTATVGQSINLSWTVTNNGTATTGISYWFDRVVFSRNQVFGDSDDIYLNEQYIYSQYGLPLDVNETYTVNSTFILPTEAAGSGYLLYKTDNYNYQGETDETDNVYVQAINVAAPNLTITNVTAPTTAVAGQSINLTWTVQNNSSATTGSSIWYDRVVFSKNQTFGDSDDVYLIEAYISDADGLPLEANETYTVNRTFNLSGQAIGNGYLLFKTDNYNYQRETNETDNVYVHAIDIAAPNLVVTNFTPPSTAIAGQSVNVSWTVKNDGSVTTGSSIWYDRLVFSKNQIFGDSDDIYITESYIYSAYGLPLEANETYTVNQTVNLPGQAIGSGYLLLKTDNYNYQGETNENDNVSVRAIDIAAPNLVVTNVTAPTTAVAGQSINLTWTVKNDSSVTTGSSIWYDRVVFSKNQIFGDSDDVYLIEEYVSSADGLPLEANETYTVNRTFNLSGQAIGNGYLLFKTDNYNYQGETNENDNVSVHAIDIAVPDLIVSEANAPNTGVVNGAINVSWTVKNQGTVAAPADWSDYIYLSTDATYSFNDTFITSQSITTQTPLAADGSYTINRSITLPNVTAGNYYLIFRGDGSGNQGETNDNNNDRAVQITIGTPDLIVSDATAPESGALGGNVSVSWTVTNQGDVAAPADWSDYIYWSSNDTYDFSDTFITTISAASQTPLAAGGSYTQTQTITLPNQTNIVGNGYLIFRADGSGNQGETNNSNNDRAVALRVDAPDLIVSNALAPESVTVGASFSVSWDVTNQGTVAANADWYDRVVISTDQIFGNGDDTYLTEVWQGSFTPLAAGGTYTRTLTVTLPTTATGDRYLLFRADNYNYQGETDENNNVRAVAINISASDLQVASTNAPTAAVLGETVELTWTVTNQGTGTATRDWYDRVYLSSNETLDGSDVQITSEYISTQTPLAAGASYTISKNVALPNFTPGNQFLLFVADRDNYQGETNENNNVRAVGINLSAPDLIVSNASAPTTGTVGKSIEVSWTVQNQGTTSASADWFDYIYLSNDQVFDANSDTYVTQEFISAQTPLAANGSYTITRNIDLPNVATGNRYLIFVADGSQNQGETNNTNNTRIVEISLNAPDLVVSNITAPVESFSGQPIDITWTVTNQGIATAEGTWWDRLYLVNAGNGAFVRDLGYFSFTGSIAAGTSLERSQSVNIPLDLTGNYKVIATTDYYGNIPEGTQNESNNTTTDDQTLQIRLSPIPNLQVSSVTAPATAFSSQDTVVQWTVTNTGTGATNAPIWYDRVYLSFDQTFDNTDTYLGQATNPSYLNAGDSYSNSLTVTLPRGIDGNYYFLVQTDANNNVTEVGNEGDNFRAGGPTDVDLTPPPDLRVTAVNAPNGAFSGQPMNLSWTVTNQGTGRTLETAWWDRVFMSADETLDAGDRILGNFYRSGALNAGQSYTGAATVSLPIGVAGNFFFFVQSDIYNQVYENVFENNNSNYDTTATNITLTPPPDLEFESLIVGNNARSGGNLSINYHVTNFGATETPNGFWTDTFYLSTDNQFNPTTDINLGSVARYGILNPGDGYDRTANFTLSNTLTGTYYVFAVTDSGDAVFEIDNNNNVTRSTNQVQIVSQPADLVITEAVIPTTGEAGKTISVQWTVKNQGAGDTIVTSWSDRIIASSDSVLGDADDIILATFTRNGLLAANGTYTRTETVNLPFSLEGNYQLFVVTDAANNVYEGSNEGNNNSNAFPVTISRQTPDLQVTAINLPATIQSGTPLNLSWTVANLGIGRTNSNFWYDEVYLSLDTTISGDDIRLGSVFRSGALNPSETYTASANFSLPVDLNGNYRVLVRTDRDNNVIEGIFENNNVKASDSTSGGGTSNGGTLPITPVPTGDLLVQSVNAPEQGIAGQGVSLTWTVVNNGANTGQTWYDAVYLSRDQVFDRNSDIYLGYRNHIGGLNAGDSYTATQTFNVPRGFAGRYYAFVVTDGGNAVYERAGESNNTNFDPFSTEIILPSPADLVVGTITIPASGTPGQSATISYTVTNQGINEAIGTWEDTVYISQDAQWDVNDAFFGRISHTGPVNAGGSYSKTITATLPGVATGDYYVIVRSDIRNNLPETSETNNIGASLDDFTLDVERLTLGTPDTGTLGQGQSVYYRVDVPAGETLFLQLDSEALDSFNELYVSFEEFPSRTTFDFASFEPFNPDQRIVIPNTQAGTYYIRAFGNEVSNSSPIFDIKAELVEFSVFDTNYGRGGNVGNLTLEINGAKFDRSVTARLADDVYGEREAVNIFYENSTEIFATFNLRGLTPGFYDVILENSDGTTIVVNDGLEVVAGGGSQILPQVDAPRSVARNRTYPFTVTWSNTGLNDGVIPVLLVENTVPFGFSPGDTSAGSSYTFLGQNTHGGPPGILRPGQIESRTFFSFSDNQPGDYLVSVDRLYKDLDALFDWELLRESLTPVGMTDEEFDPVFNQLIGQVGTTNGDYLRMLSENSSLLPAELGSPDDIGVLLAIELAEAQAAVSTSIKGVLVAEDLDVDISGRTVIATNTETSEQFETITLNDGSFTLANLSPGIYTYQVGLAPFESAAPNTTVALGEAISGLSLEIGRGAIIMGEVENEISLPISEAVIGVYQSGELIAATQADTNGNFKIMGLEAGTYILKTYLPNSLESFANEVTVAANEVVTLSLSDTETPPLMLSTSQNNLEPLASGVEDSSPILANFEIPNPFAEEIKARIRQALGNIVESILEEAVELAIEAVGEVTQELVDSIVESATDLYLDGLELVVSPAVQAGALWVGGFAAQALYSQYFNSTGPNGTRTFGDQSPVSNSFKNNAVTKRNINAIQSEAFKIIQDLFQNEIFDCDHPEIVREFSLASLNIPSQALLNAIGGAADPGGWDFPFKQDLAGVIAGGNGEGGGPGSNRPIFPDYRRVEGVAKLTIPESSSQAEVVFEIVVTIGDTVDFEPGNTARDLFLVGDLLEGAKVLEKNGRAFDVPFISTFKVDPETFNFSVALEDDCDEDPDDEDDIDRPTSVDPNDILGPDGFGEDRWIRTGTPLAYKIRFENDPIFAEAPAQVVRITQQLDSDLDFRTFRVGDFGFGSLVIDVPDNRSFYQERVDLSQTLGIFVDVAAGIDVTTGEIFWEFTTIDPTTGELPIDALTGFLPPNLTSPEGEGFVNYSVSPKRNLSTGTVIDAEAVIVFDTNEPISTPPIFNTLDVDVPTSQVNTLSSSTDTPEFLVSWAGTDTGSALATYTIYVSDNGGEYTVWLEDTELTEATYTGTPGHTYAFYSVAVDNAGNTEAAATTADATIQVGGAVNQPPQISTNTGLSLDEGASSVISVNILAVADTDNTADQLILTLNEISTNGNLKRNGVNLAVNDTFTQADINAGLLSYAHNGGETTNDSFSFTVADGAGGSISITTFAISINPVDDAPVIQNAIANVTIDEDADNTVIDLTNVFRDVDTPIIATSIFANSNTGLVTATIVNNQLTLDYQANQSGTAEITLRGTANGKFIDDIFTVAVNPVDDAPVIQNAIADVTIDEDADNTVIDLTNVFSDVDGDAIATSIFANTNVGLVTATIIDNQLILDYQQNQFGTAEITIRGTAGSQFVDQTFQITVNSINDAPVLENALADQTATKDTLFNFTFPANTFNDIDAGDNLTYFATLEDGDELPTWLTFDAATRTFSGTPGDTDVGTLNIKVTARDNSEDSISDIFILTVADTNTNNAPTLAVAIADQTATENTNFSFTIPATTFVDIDAGDILSYTVSLENGGNLPDWLTFDTTTRTFSGTPTDTASGTYNITVTVTDTAAASVSDTFTLNVLNFVNGTSGNETINGTNGDDVIDGGAGSDRLVGGDGNDTYIVDSIRDVVVESAGQGIDTVKSSVSHTLIANVENLILTGTANINGTGNELDNSITGNSGNNILKGLAGNDTLIGGDGNDTLVGGAGNDSLTGGAGADTFLFGSGAAFTNTAFGTDTITDFSKGIDKIALSKASFTALTSAVNSSLLASEFAIINVALTDEMTTAGISNAKIIYNQTTQNLLYNQNGATSGLGNGGIFANLNATLEANDFLVQS